MRRAIIGTIALLWLFSLFSCGERAGIEVLTPMTDDGQTHRVVESAADSEEEKALDIDETREFTVNPKSGVFHADPACPYVIATLPENRLLRLADARTLLGEGLRGCKRCVGLEREETQGEETSIEETQSEETQSEETSIEEA